MSRTSTPERVSSQAVRRAPCSTGRASVASTCGPRACVLRARRSRRGRCRCRRSRGGPCCSGSGSGAARAGARAPLRADRVARRLVLGVDPERLGERRLTDRGRPNARRRVRAAAAVRRSAAARLTAVGRVAAISGSSRRRTASASARVAGRGLVEPDHQPVRSRRSRWPARRGRPASAIASFTSATLESRHSTSASGRRRWSMIVTASRSHQTAATARRSGTAGTGAVDDGEGRSGRPKGQRNSRWWDRRGRAPRTCGAQEVGSGRVGARTSAQCGRGQAAVRAGGGGEAGDSVSAVPARCEDAHRPVRHSPRTDPWMAHGHAHAHRLVHGRDDTARSARLSSHTAIVTQEPCVADRSAIGRCRHRAGRRSRSSGSRSDSASRRSAARSRTLATSARSTSSAGVGWTKQRSAQLLAICQSLPGPASSQLGIAIGTLRAGPPAASPHSLGFTPPSAIALVAFAALTATADVATSGWLHGIRLVAVPIVGARRGRPGADTDAGLARRAIALIALVAMLLLPGAPTQLGRHRGGRGHRRRRCSTDARRPRASIPVRHRPPSGARVACLTFAAILVLLPIARAACRPAKRGRPSPRRTRSTGRGRSSSAAAMWCCRCSTRPSSRRAGSPRTGSSRATAPHRPSRDRCSRSRPISAGRWARDRTARQERCSLSARSSCRRSCCSSASCRSGRASGRFPRAAGALAGVNAVVVGLLIAALYSPGLDRLGHAIGATWPWSASTSSR